MGQQCPSGLFIAMQWRGDLDLAHSHFMCYAKSLEATVPDQKKICLLVDLSHTT